MSFRQLHRLLAISPFLSGLALRPAAAVADPATQLGISYADYDLVSLVLKDKSFLQADAMAQRGQACWLRTRHLAKASPRAGNRGTA